MRQVMIGSIVLAGVLQVGAPERLGAQATDALVVPDTSAGRYVGRRVTVVGPVANVKVSGHRHTIYVNFRRPYPDHSFSAWIPDSLAGEFPDIESLQGRVARVTGTVWLQDGRWPAMTLRQRQDLEVVPDSATTH